MEKRVRVMYSVDEEDKQTDKHTDRDLPRCVLATAIKECLKLSTLHKRNGQGIGIEGPIISQANYFIAT